MSDESSSGLVAIDFIEKALETLPPYNLNFCGMTSSAVSRVMREERLCPCREIYV